MKIYACLWRAKDNLRRRPQKPSTLFLRQGLLPSLELAHEGKLASQRALGIYPLPPLGQGDNSVLLCNGGHDRIGKATEGTAPSVKEPRIGCGLNFITVDQYSVVTTQDINIRSQWVAARGSAGCELYLAFL